jgi:hypothetical protein
VFAVLYAFGIKCHVSADKLVTFFKLIHLNTHVSTSTSAIRNQMNSMDKLLPLFQQRCEDEAPQSRKAVMAADETFSTTF